MLEGIKNSMHCFTWQIPVSITNTEKRNDIKVTSFKIHNGMCRNDSFIFLTFMKWLHQRSFVFLLDLSLATLPFCLTTLFRQAKIFNANLIRTLSLATLWHSSHRRENQSWHKFSAAMVHFKCITPGISKSDGEKEFCSSWGSLSWETQLVLLAVALELSTAHCDCPTPPTATNLALWGSAGQNSQWGPRPFCHF